MVNSHHGVMDNRAPSIPPSYSAEHNHEEGKIQLPIQSLPFMDVTEAILTLGNKISFYSAANLPATAG